MVPPARRDEGRRGRALLARHALRTAQYRQRIRLRDLVDKYYSCGVFACRISFIHAAHHATTVSCENRVACAGTFSNAAALVTVHRDHLRSHELQ